jgi:hypothetical protein
MLASFYLCSRSLEYNGTDSNSDIIKKLSSLFNLIAQIYKTPNNEFLLNPQSFCDTVVFSGGEKVSDIISYNTSINRDIRNQFISMFSYAKRDINASYEDMIEYLSLEDENNCNALLVLNIIKDLESHIEQVISNIKDWRTFMRKKMIKYIKDGRTFVCDSKYYFPNLRFSCTDLFYSDLSNILKTHICLLVNALSLLNDKFISVYRDGNSFDEAIHKFSCYKEIDGCSLEGKKYNELNIDFKNEEGESITKYCEPHIKINKPDKDKKRRGDYHDLCRIYFAKPDEESDIIYVGAICHHHNT